MTELVTTSIPHPKVVRFWSIFVITIGVIGTLIGYMGSKNMLIPPATSLLIHQQQALAEVKNDITGIKARVGNLEHETSKLASEINLLKNKK